MSKKIRSQIEARLELADDQNLYPQGVKILPPVLKRTELICERLGFEDGTLGHRAAVGMVSYLLTTQPEDAKALVMILNKQKSKLRTVLESIGNELQETFAKIKE